MNIKNFFLNHPVFRHEEFVAFMRNKNPDISQYNIKYLLNYHVKTGNIINIRRNLYGSIGNKNTWVDPYLIAAKATKNSFLGYHTAMEIHEIAYTTFNELTYVDSRTNKPFDFQDISFKSVIDPKKKNNKIDEMLFIDEINRDSIKIRVTSLERTIVDVLDRPNISGGYEEIFKSFDRIVNFDQDKLVKYALILNKASTIAKVGYFLTTLPTYIEINSKNLNKLKSHIPKSPYYMDKTKKSKFYSEWNLLVPLEIIEKKWEEPNEDYI